MRNLGIVQLRPWCLLPHLSSQRQEPSVIITIFAVGTRRIFQRRVGRLSIDTLNTLSYLASCPSGETSTIAVYESELLSCAGLPRNPVL